MARIGFKRLRRRRPRKTRQNPRPKKVGHVGRQLTTGVHYFKRMFQGPELSINNISTILGGLEFKFNQLPGYTDFTTLFDEYRINGIGITFYPLNTSADLNPASSALTTPNFHTVVDYDDSLAPADLNAMLQYPNHTMTRGVSKHTRYFVPRVAYQVYKTAIASGYGTRAKTWIDMENVDVPHYGLKWAFDGNYGTGTGALVYKSYVTMYFACRGVR